MAPPPPPNRVLTHVHDVLRLPPSRALHDPIHSWTTVSLHGTAPGHPAAIAITCWLIPPAGAADGKAPALNASLRFSAPPGSPPRIRCAHPRLHSMLIHAFRRNPSPASRDLEALAALYPDTPPNTAWHILRPVPIDGRMSLPARSAVHGTAAAASICQGCSLSIELRPPPNNGPASTPRVSAATTTPGHLSPLPLQNCSRRLLQPLSPIRDWLYASYLHQRYRHVQLRLHHLDPALAAAALDSLCPLLEIHAHANPSATPPKT